MSVSVPDTTTPNTTGGLGSPKELSQRLARLTLQLRGTIVALLETGDGDEPMRRRPPWLVGPDAPGTTALELADAHAQTITHGLFVARCLHHLHLGPERFDRTSLSSRLPRTSPLLQDMFEAVAGPQLPERVAEVVDGIAEVLAHTDMDAVLRDLGGPRGDEDPLVHFYAAFLSDYDPTLKGLRGVYYTPKPVVRYIVASVDVLLRRAFGLSEGLARGSTVRGGDHERHEVLLLDPAAGTGAFLQGIVELVAARSHDAGTAPRSADHVSRPLLPRLFGFECLMAPHAVAHLKLGMTLEQHGHRLDDDDRPRLYLGNALESAPHLDASSELARLLAHEPGSAPRPPSRQPRRPGPKPILVVLGNPPYSGHSANRANKALREYAHAYKQDEHGSVYPELKKPGQAKWLSDDYVKFMRFAETRISSTGHGVLAFITNHAWLDNPTFFGMRKSLYETFDEIWILDLHGNSKKKEVTPEGGKDENVFEIQQGTAISVLVRYQDRSEAREKKVHHAHLWGTRTEKYDYLASHDISTTRWTTLDVKPPPWPGAPAWMFVPVAPQSRWDELACCKSIPEIFSGMEGDPAPGMLTTHDELAISWSKEEMIQKVETLLATKNEREARKAFRLCKQSQWSYDRAKRQLAATNWRDQIVEVYYRPFDRRYTVYDSNVTVHRRERVSGQMLDGNNIALLTTRMAKGEPFNHALVTTCAHEVICLSPKTSTNAFGFPLWRRATDEGTTLPSAGRRTNLDPEFIRSLPGRPRPPRVFAYVYALLHAPGYRRRYHEILRMDWPRIPATNSPELFARLATLGEALIGLHTGRTKPPAKTMPSYPVMGSNRVDRAPRWTDQNVWINGTQYFEGVPRSAWELRIGGYQPAQKWLKDRRAPAYAALDIDDVTHYRTIIGVLQKTEALMQEIDLAIETHGGWPLR